ncbi:MAG: hypothetical protein WC475_00895 [Candidatus Paceibacterota bacterium]
MDRFKLYKKWFWIGIIIGFFNSLWGIVYGIALWVERDHRKEGMIITIWSIISGIVSIYVIRWIILNTVFIKH